jgi:hypothetical protein
MMNYEAQEGQMSRDWHTRYELRPAPVQHNMTDFNNGEHAEPQRANNPVRETVFDITTHTGIANPAKVDHYVDPYTDLVSMNPVTESK